MNTVEQAAAQIVATPIVASSEQEAIQKAKEKIGKEGDYHVAAKKMVGDSTVYLVIYKPNVYFVVSK